MGGGDLPSTLAFLPFVYRLFILFATAPFAITVRVGGIMSVTSLVLTSYVKNISGQLFSDVIATQNNCPH